MDKEFILSEIKRTAAENGGKPLGRERFESMTGIGKPEWFRHWVSWSDALREAGYAPNTMNASIDATSILGHFAALAIELGHLPSADELKFRARRGPSFPSHTVFRRFGGKADLVAKTAEYCRQHPGLEEVVRMCEEYAPPRRSKEARSTGDASSTEEGFVYLLKHGRHYKIGKTNAVGRREYEIALQMPERLEKVHVIRTDDPSGIEAYWHRRFAGQRTNGEWFALSTADVRAFKRRKFM